MMRQAAAKGAGRAEAVQAVLLGMRGQECEQCPPSCSSREARLAGGHVGPRLQQGR